MGALQAWFGSEIPRPPSFVQWKEGAASSAGGGTAHGPSPGEKPWRVRGTPAPRVRRNPQGVPVWGDRGSQIPGVPTKQDVLWGITPAAFGDFWPVKSRAPVPARGRIFPAPLARIE